MKLVMLSPHLCTSVHFSDDRKLMLRSGKTYQFYPLDFTSISFFQHFLLLYPKAPLSHSQHLLAFE